MKTPYYTLAALLFAGITTAVFAAEPAKNLLKPTAKAESWEFEQQDGGKGTFKAEEDAIVVVVEEITGIDWNVQLIQPGLELKEGQTYDVSFKAKASAQRPIQIYVGVAEDDFHPVGCDELINVTKEWAEHKATFKAEGVAAKGNNRLGFLLGQEKGTVWLKDVTLLQK